MRDMRLVQNQFLGYKFRKANHLIAVTQRCTTYMCSGNAVTCYYVRSNKCVAYVSCVKQALDGPPLIVSIIAKRSSDY